MIEDVIYPLSTELFGPGVYEVVWELFLGCSVTIRLIFQGPGSVPGGDKGHRIYFYPSSGYFHHCKNMVFVLARL